MGAHKAIDTTRIINRLVSQFDEWFGENTMPDPSKTKSWVRPESGVQLLCFRDDDYEREGCGPLEIWDVYLFGTEDTQMWHWTLQIGPVHTQPDIAFLLHMEQFPMGSAIGILLASKWVERFESLRHTFVTAWKAAYHDDTEIIREALEISVWAIIDTLPLTGESYENEPIKLDREDRGFSWTELPQATQIKAMIELANSLSDEEAEALLEAQKTTGADELAKIFAAWDASTKTMIDSGRSEAWTEIEEQFWVVSAVDFALRALLLRDLIDENTEWNQEAYDMLTSWWVKAGGPVHPDDVCRTMKEDEASKEKTVSGVSEKAKMWGAFIRGIEKALPVNDGYPPRANVDYSDLAHRDLTIEESALELRLVDTKTRTVVRSWETESLSSINPIPKMFANIITTWVKEQFVDIFDLAVFLDDDIGLTAGIMTAQWDTAIVLSDKHGEAIEDVFEYYMDSYPV